MRAIVGDEFVGMQITENLSKFDHFYSKIKIYNHIKSKLIIML